MNGFALCGSTLRALTLLVGITPLFAEAGTGVTMTREMQTDRPGRDFFQYVMPRADSYACASACAANARCRAYTYVKPGYQAPQAKCYFKTNGTQPVANRYAISGEKNFVFEPSEPRGDAPIQIERPDQFGQKAFCEMRNAMCGVNRIGQWNDQQMNCECRDLKPGE